MADFYYSLDGKKWIKIGSQLKMAYTLPHFMGYRFGLFNYATKTSGGMWTLTISVSTIRNKAIRNYKSIIYIEMRKMKSTLSLWGSASFCCQFVWQYFQ